MYALETLRNPKKLNFQFNYFWRLFPLLYHPQFVVGRSVQAYSYSSPAMISPEHWISFSSFILDIRNDFLLSLSLLSLFFFFIIFFSISFSYFFFKSDCSSLTKGRLPQRKKEKKLEKSFCASAASPALLYYFPGAFYTTSPHVEFRRWLLWVSYLDLSIFHRQTTRDNYAATLSEHSHNQIHYSFSSALKCAF